MLKVTYDGDKMVSRPLFTQEANKEAKEFLDNPSSVFTLDGTNYRGLINRDTVSGLYALTLDKDKVARIPDDLGKQLAETDDMNLILSYVTDTVDKKAKYNICSPFKYTYQWGTRKGTIETTLGRALFNYRCLSVIDGEYYNEVLTKNAQEDVMGRESKRAYTIIDENNEHFKKFTLFLTRWEEMAFTATGIWGPSIDLNVFNGSDKYNKYREKLIKESQAELDKGNLVVYDEMEKKLIDAYKDDLKERKIDTEIYDSGSKLAVKDDLRMAVMSVGPMPIGVGAGKYAISSSCLIKGTSIKERHLYAQSNIVAGYFRAMGPATGGEIGKEVYAAVHDVMLAEHNTDCGSKETVELYIDKYMTKQLEYYYHYKKGGVMELLTPELLEKYKGQYLNVRTPITCKWKNEREFCSCCSGEKPYMIARTDDKIRIGAQMSKLGDEITNASLKKFHSSKVQYIYVDFNKFIIPASGQNDLREMNEAAQYNISESIAQNLVFLSRIMNVNESTPEDFDDVLDELDREMDDLLTEYSDIYLPDVTDELLSEEIDKDVISFGRLDEYLDVFTENRLAFAQTDNLLTTGQLEGTNPNLIAGVKSYISTVMRELTNLDIDTFINNLISHEDITKPFLYDVDERNGKVYSRLFIPIADFDYEQYIIHRDDDSLVEPQKFAFMSILAIEQIKKLLNLGNDWKFSEDSEGSVISLYLELDKIITYDKETLSLSEAPMDQATKNKMYSKLKSNGDRIRSKYEQIIQQALRNASITKQRIKKDLAEDIVKKGASLEQEMRAAKEVQRKKYIELLQQFEANYIKANRFRLQKIKNKLNFILAKKYRNVDYNLNNTINKIKNKMYAKIKTSNEKIRTKYE